jgi:glycogen(starch) synthase
VRILAVSSLYPPDCLGGYELACAEIMSRLRGRGHEVHILTSRCSSDASSLPPDDRWVHSALDFAPLSQTQVEDIVTRARREWRNNKACRYWARAIQPDVISVWDMWGLLPSLLTTLERTGAPLTYAISSFWVLEYVATPHRWPAFWNADGSSGFRRWLPSTFRSLVRTGVDRTMPTAPPRPDLRRAFFASHALRVEHSEAGLNCEDAPIIHHGVDIERFAPGDEKAGKPRGSLLVSGRVVREKGFHTAIEALFLLTTEDGAQELTLDIVGPHPDPEYALSLRQMVAQRGLENSVRFQPQVPRKSMPDIYHNHDILIFSSTWGEPFALTMLEAMACGLPVVGTITGGSKEILEHGITGLVFTAGDAASLAGQLRRILTEVGLGRTLAHRAQKRVRQNLAIEKTVARIEDFLSANARE